MAKLIITRETGIWGNGRKAKIIIDNGKTDILRNKSTIDIDVAPGKHVVKAKFDMITKARKMEIDIKENESIYLRFSVNRAAHIISMILILPILLFSIVLVLFALTLLLATFVSRVFLVPFLFIFRLIFVEPMPTIILNVFFVIAFIIMMVDTFFLYKLVKLDK